jgi:hypothetical protein
MNENNLLKPVYSRDEISVRSISKQACVNSAYAFLNGLYASDLIGMENL